MDLIEQPGPFNIVSHDFPPRNTQRLIDTVEIKIGGQTRQLINDYGFIYNMINDYTSSFDATSKTANKIALEQTPIHHVNIIILNLVSEDIVDIR